MNRPDVTKAVLDLEYALKYDLVKLEFIKVDRLPIINGDEVTHIAGIPLLTHIGEHQANYFLMSKPQADGGGKDGGDE